MKIKCIKVINSYRILINGEEYVKRKGFTTELEALYNHIHIILQNNMIHIKGDICFYCGKIFKRDKKSLTKHHSILTNLNSKYNVLIPVCRKCHTKINKGVKRLPIPIKKEE